jgi:hypothetical protein
MLRSFHYASYAALLGQAPGVRPEDFATLEPWARFWYLAVSGAFLKGYLDVVGSTTLLPRTPDELRTLLDAYLLEKAIYEVSYELIYRPPWVRTPSRESWISWHRCQALVSQPNRLERAPPCEQEEALQHSVRPLRERTEPPSLRK